MTLERPHSATIAEWRSALKTILTEENFKKIKDFEWWKLRLLLKEFHKLGRDKEKFNKIFPLLVKKLELKQRQLEILHRIEQHIKEVL